ncbi:MAG: hypothetical protein JXB26_08525 [Candidatus Aminicenantes bacterium]|nr:hypothetical protein [Candidatus Aminicenantes bacterium]
MAEDFHFESLRENIGPLVMYLGESRGKISFRFKAQEVSSVIGLLKQQWKEFLPNQPFEYSFLDERFEQMYQAEQRIGKIFTIFASLAIFVGCLIPLFEPLTLSYGVLYPNFMMHVCGY